MQIRLIKILSRGSNPNENNCKPCRASSNSKTKTWRVCKCKWMHLTPMSDFTQLAFHTPIKAYKHINHLWTTDGLCCIRPLWRYTISLLWNGHSLFCSDHQPSWHNACWTSRWRLTASWSSLTWPWKLTSRSTGCSSLCHPTLSPISNAPGAANGIPLKLEAAGAQHADCSHHHSANGYSSLPKRHLAEKLST